MGIGAYKEGIKHYETFFAQLKENNRFSDRIILLDEWRNLFNCYMNILYNNIRYTTSESCDKDRILQLTHKLAIIEKDNSVLKTIFFILDNTVFKKNPYTAFFTEQFEMLPNTSTLNKIKFYYRIKDLEKSKALVEEMIRENAFQTKEEENLTLMYRYLIELSEVVAKTDPHSDAIGDEELETAIRLFRDYYADKTHLKYNRTNIELSGPIQETHIVVNEKSPYSIYKIKDILSKIHTHIPYERVRIQALKQVNELEKDTYEKTK